MVTITALKSAEEDQMKITMRRKQRRKKTSFRVTMSK